MSANHIITTDDGRKIECYGKWREDSNVLIVGTFADGEEFEEIWADGADSWDDAYSQLKDWAARIGLEIEEMTAC